jgi:Flp pilus assembly protein TadG
MLTHARSRRRPPLRRSGQQGVVAVVVAMTIVAMVGMVGLAIDLGQMFIAKTEVQNSADACALAAVRDMYAGLPTPTVKAEASGRTVANLHRAGFQSKVIGGTTTPVSITFATTAAGPYTSGAGLSTSQAAAMKYVRCDVSYSGIKTFFIQALNAIPGVSIGDQQVSAFAVATLLPSQSACAIPIALCVADAVPTKIGTWLPGPLQSGNDSVAGEFGWVDLTDGGKGTADIGAQLISDGVCTLPAVGTAIPASGNKVALASYFNSRFGVYFGSVKVGDAAPDTTGYAYTYKTWPAMSNAYGDLTNKRTAFQAYQGDSTVTGIDIQGTVQPSSYLQANGRDRRVVMVPIVQCGADGKIPKEPVLADWGCVFLIQPVAKNDPKGLDCFGSESGTGTKVCVEYRGKANDSGSPCASNGLPGSPTSPGARVPALVK